MAARSNHILSKRLQGIVRRFTRRRSDSGAEPTYQDDHPVSHDLLRCEIAYNKYGGYCVPRSSQHRPAARRILAGEVYEPDTLAYIASHCDGGDIVHAGTYFGDFLPALSAAVVPGATIWAFEPNRESFRCARVTLEINNIHNVVLTNAGLGEAQGELLVQTLDESGQSLGGASRILSTSESDRDGVERVSVVPVDDMVALDRHVSIIQLDVEDYEKEALTGALQTIRRCLPIIILEVRSGSTLLDSSWFSDHILALGYRRTGDVHKNAIYACR